MNGLLHCAHVNTANAGTTCQQAPLPKENGASKPCALALPELLSPAGDWDCARAAVENGADAIYFGLERFNARMRAQNFTEADLPKLLEYLHRRGVKGYVTLNTLVFQNELADAELYLRAMITAGVDAVIVQDIGICRLIRQLSPDFPIHASTQMTITSARGLAFAKELGCNLVVLARECSLKEIQKIQEAQAEAEPEAETPGNTPPEQAADAPPVDRQTQPTADHGPRTIDHRQLPIEVFVHGALCVAYSGQCLTSEALGGRSANRGECAQACRMPYELLSDGQKVALGDRRYLLSPQDLSGLELLPELARLGVTSLKIEGRLKSPEYVANITRVYRKALDLLRGLRPGIRDEEDEPHTSFTRHQDPAMARQASDSSAAKLNRFVAGSRYEVEMAFSRGLYTGWFGGVNNQALVHARFGKKRGVFLGEVESVRDECILVTLQAPLKPGDGVVFDADTPETNEEGGRVYITEKRGNQTRVAFGRGNIDFRRVQKGNKLWKTSDPELDRRLRQTFIGEKPRFQRSVDLEVHGKIGGPLTVVVRDETGHVVQVNSTQPLASAQTQPLTTERLREHLGRLGGTQFYLGELHNHLAAGVILPLGELNRLRREWVSQLEQLRAQPKRWTLLTAGERETTALHHRTHPHPSPSAAQADTHLIVLVRNQAQLNAALQAGVPTVYCEFEDPKKYREAVRAFRDWQKQHAPCPTGSGIYVAPPRIFKAGEDWVLKQVRSSDADGYLVRNYDHLAFFTGCRCVGDYSLNVANALSAEYFKRQFGLERLTPSYDLNAAQLESLLKAAPPDWFEITLHQHIPMFHMEHCVFCAFLSSGTDYTNCGRPCDKHDLQIRDRVGAKHPVKADAGCRNTVFNALAQTGAEHVTRFRQLGIRLFRIEFLNEPPELVERTVQQYRALLSGKITASALWRELKLLNQLGVTRGQMDKG